MNLRLTNVFFIISIFQLLLISIFLLTHDKGKRLSNQLLGSFFLSIGLNLIDTFLQFNHVYNSHPSLAFWGSCLPLTFGPLLYLYVQSLFYKDFAPNWKKYRHFIPFFAFFILTEVSYLLQTRVYQETLLRSLEVRKAPGYLPWTACLIFLHFLAYSWASLRIIQHHKKEARSKFSDPVYNNVSSISAAIIFFMVIMTTAAVNQLSLLTPLAKYFYGVFSVMLVFMFLFISQVLIKSMRRTDLFSLAEEKPGAIQENGFGVSEIEKNKLLLQLREHMEKSRPFIKPDLTIEQLATQLSLHPRVLSHVINNSLQQNFFDFINRYRIEEARQLLMNNPDKKITILEVLYKVGFNSKSSFNTLFKKYTGLTPSEFRRNKM